MNQKERLPAALAAVALIDAKTCAAAGSMSESWWQEEVRTGRAPQPAIRAPRCTRWACAEVADFWRHFPERAAGVTHAEKATAAAKAKRGQHLSGRAAQAVTVHTIHPARNGGAAPPNSDEARSAVAATRGPKDRSTRDASALAPFAQDGNKPTDTL